MSYPKYVCHKEVSAAKIASVEFGGDGCLVVHFEGPYQHLVIPQHERRNKPVPDAGWYFIVYEDGYTSFSPAKSFEEGYALKPSDPERTQDGSGSEKYGASDWTASGMDASGFPVEKGSPEDVTS